MCMCICACGSFNATVQQYCPISKCFSAIECNLLVLIFRVIVIFFCCIWNLFYSWLCCSSFTKYISNILTRQGNNVWQKYFVVCVLFFKPLFFFTGKNAISFRSSKGSFMFKWDTSISFNGKSCHISNNCVFLRTTNGNNFMFYTLWYTFTFVVGWYALSLVFFFFAKWNCDVQYYYDIECRT